MRPRKKKLSTHEVKYFLKLLDETSDLEPKFGIVRVDTIVENILRARGWKWNLGTMLRLLPRWNITNNLWKYHKMRNILVHETQWIPVSRKDVELFIDVAKSLLK
jgi:hypothetical protein